ncbi:unnamed protein product [Symbiodinium necroappetens]|uniref:Uncharacterized protein n=1 Tax=Symbiodinium necroappetens TaxID=1628268 RepID=A0A813BYJ1_9DINO|nr:unnamed protein product [Symbiodinium necroappetens]
MALIFGLTALEVNTQLILSVCIISTMVADMMDQPYARSLVQCDVPVNTTEGAEFSGSKLCGNRLHVIGVGAEVSGWGQSFGNAGRLFITLFLSGLADYGRRRAALLGQFLATLSAVLFASAQFLPTSLSFPSYILGKGLQGMSGLGILQEIITGDVALQLNDTVAVYGRRQVLHSCILVMIVPINLYVQWVEMTDFTYISAVVVVLNLSALTLLSLFFPETLTSKKEKKDIRQFSILGLVKDEIQNFRSLIQSHDYISLRMAEEVVSKMAALDAIGLAFLMANFNFSQFDALVFTSLPAILGGVSLSWVVPRMCRQFGHKIVMKSCILYYRLSGCILAFLQPFSFLGIPMPLIGLALHLPLSGIQAVGQGIEIRLVQQENNAKFQAMCQMLGFLCGSITSGLYPQLFNAEASTYGGKVLPYAVSAFINALSIPVFLFLTGPMMLAECEKVDKEATAKAL